MFAGVRGILANDSLLDHKDRRRIFGRDTQERKQQGRGSRPRQLWIHIGTSHHFDSSVPHCSESSQITSATACASVFKGTTLFVPEGRLFLAGYSRRHECSESSGKNPAEGQTRHAGKLRHCSLLRAIVFKNEPVPANGDRPRRRGSSLQTLF